MSDQAAAPAPATEPVVAELDTQVELSEDEALSQAFDSLQESETEEPTAEEPDDATADEPEVQEVVEPGEIEVPTDLPGALKAVWKDLPEEARETVLRSHRDLSAKYSQAAREIQGIGPIKDAVYRAAQDIPGFANQKPGDIAQEVYRLAKVSADLQRDPEATIRSVAAQYGINLGGQQPQGQAQQVISGLQRQVAELTNQVRSQLNPDRMQQEFDRWNTEHTVVSEVQNFSASQPHWEAVEDKMPAAIQFVQAKLGPTATPSQVLQEAYDMAVNTFVPNARAATEPGGDEPSPQAPQRVKTAVKAKSVNVQSKPGGNARPLTEDEALAAAWDKINND